MSKPPCDHEQALKPEAALLEIPVILHALSRKPDALEMLADVMQAMIDASYERGFEDGRRVNHG